MQNRSVVIMLCTTESYTKGMVNYFIIFFVKGVVRNMTSWVQNYALWAN